MFHYRLNAPGGQVAATGEFDGGLVYRASLLVPNQTYSFTVWFDLDGNSSEDAGEQSLAVSVTTVDIGDVEVYDSASDFNYYQTASREILDDMYLTELSNLRGHITFVTPDFDPTTSAAADHVLWEVVGNGVEGEQDGVLDNHLPNIDLRPPADGQRSFQLRVGFDDDMDGILDGNEASHRMNLHLVGVEHTVDNNVVTLTDGNPLRVQTHRGNGSETPTHKFQIRWDGGGDNWYDLGSTQSSAWRYPTSVAGHFDTRVVSSIGGRHFASNLENMEVQFPDYAVIEADADVRAKTDRVWADSLAASLAGDTHEKGFWILLNTQSLSYEFTSVKRGPEWTDPAQIPSIKLGPRPSDSHANPTPLSSPTYAVASFHTHPPVIFAGYGRATGPSGTGGPTGGGDKQADTLDDVAGIVYDYSAPYVASGHNPNDPAQRYWTGPGAPVRRSTP